MTWKNRLENIEFEITTGDGKVWKPLWKNFKKNLKFNTEGFNFINVNGTYVGRKKKSGNQYPLLFYFQGEDCIDIAEKFEKSSEDSRAWIIKHPFLGTIKAQPLSFEFDYSKYNMVKITGIVWETIARKYPQSEISPVDNINQLKTDIDTSIEILSENSQIPVTVENIQSAKKSVTSIGSAFREMDLDSGNIADLRDLVRSASAAAEDIISNYTNYINQVIALINFPFQVSDSIDSKLNVMIEAATSLLDLLTKNDPKDAEMYEFTTSSIVSEASRSAVNASYETINESLDAIDLIILLFDSTKLGLESSIKIPNGNLSQETDIIVNTSVSDLFEIAFDAKQERIVVLLNNTSPVLLAHKYYGPGDENLVNFIEKNQLSLDEYLIINKGRKILYFV